jgi:anaerobic selenocysteine-containing dehydrogenase
LPDAVLDGNPYPVKALFVQSTNPVMSDPNRDRVQRCSGISSSAWRSSSS